MIPYTPDVFFSLFERYNAAIWPVQLIAFVLGLLAIWMTLRPAGPSSRLIAAILACFWLWNAIAYHLFYFAMINFWAIGFAALFAIAALAFVWSGAVKGRLEFGAAAGLARQAGLFLMVFGLAIYPVLAWSLGHAYPRAPAFGVAPCPTALFTLGALMTCAPRPGWGVVSGPLLWAAIGGSSAFLLGVYEDLSLWLAALAFLALRTR